jgi:hypothetical protein
MADNDLKPGLQLDKLIAEKVLGWYQDSNVGGPRSWWFKKGKEGDIQEGALYLDHFSTDIRAAWKLVEKFDLWVVPWHENNWTAVKENDIFVEIGNQNQAPTAPHAICLAALNYQDNVLRCSRHRTREENYREVINALNALLGYTITDKEFKEGNGTVGFYRSLG